MFLALQDSLINLCNDRIFIGSLDLCHAVDLIHSIQPGLFRPRSDRHRLSTTGNTASFTCHHFYEIILDFTGFDPLQQCSAQRRPFTTAIFTVLSSSWMEASLIPSIPRIPVKLMSCRSSILLLCTRRLRTASVTPPVTPKIAAAPKTDQTAYPVPPVRSATDLFPLL